MPVSEIRSQPVKYPWLKSTAEGLQSLKDLGNKYEVKPWVPLLGGTGLGDIWLARAPEELLNISYGNYPMRMQHPYAGRTASYLPDVKPGRQQPLADALFLGADVVPMVGALAKAGKPLAKAGARVVGEELNRAILDNSGALAKLVPQAAKPMYVVKPEGPSNWLPGSVESNTDRLTQLPTRDPLIEAPWRQGATEDPELRKIWEYMYSTGNMAILPNEQAAFLLKYYPDKLADFGFAYTPEANALNTFVDKRLNKYIRNEMATESDPLRAMAEEGRLHYDPAEPTLGEQTNVAMRRHKSGFPAGGSAESQMARRWEILSDNAIEGKPVSEWEANAKPEVLAKMPWMEHLGPSDIIFERTDPSINANLGFRHLIDELKNSMDEATDLPQHLRLKPKQVEQMTVENAAEHVAKINDWRAEQAAKAEMEGLSANLSGQARLVDESFTPSFANEQGGKWVDIPDTRDEAGLQYCTTIGKAGGWCTQGSNMAKTYGSGENRLTALLDADGRPHAQATIYESPVLPRWEDVQQYIPESLQEAAVKMPSSSPDEINTYANQLAAQKAKQAMPKDITELKPVGNSLSSDRAQTYAKRDPEYKNKISQSVVNFLNSGNWGKMPEGDLKHLGIIDVRNSKSVDEIPGIDFDAFVFAREHADENTPRFMTQQQFKEFLAPFIDQTPGQASPGLGYAEGGAVKTFKEGGLVYDPAEVDSIVDEFYGLRVTGEPKGRGALGEIRMPDGQTVMTEYSINVDGEEIPSIVEGMHPADLNYIRETGDVPQDAIATAVRSARKRKAEGKSPFYDEQSFGLGGVAKAVARKTKLGKITKELREKGYKAELQRAERIADEAPEAAERIDEEALRSAIIGGDNAESLTIVEPTEFLRLAQSIPDWYKASPTKISISDELQLTPSEYMEYLGKVAQKQGFKDIPFIQYGDRPRGSGVLAATGHEGRHRMHGLAGIGDEKALIRLIPRGDIREPLPRRSRSEFIDALLQKYGLDMRLYPEDEKILTPIKVEPFAEGGTVKTQDILQAPPRSPLLGFAADASKNAQLVINSIVPIGDFLFGDTTKMLDDWSYGRGPVQLPAYGRNPATIKVNPAIIDAASYAWPVAKAGIGVTKMVGKAKNLAPKIATMAEKYLIPMQSYVIPPEKSSTTQQMLQGLYRGYAGDSGKETVLFASPQKKVADYYAQKRALETGKDPHVEMLLVEQNAGTKYGHSTLGTGKNPPLVTQARKLKPEEVKQRTKLYATGGYTKINGTVHPEFDFAQINQYTDNNTAVYNDFNFQEISDMADNL